MVVLLQFKMEESARESLASFLKETDLTRLLSKNTYLDELYWELKPHGVRENPNLWSLRLKREKLLRADRPYPTRQIRWCCTRLGN